MMGERGVMQEALFYGFSLERGASLGAIASSHPSSTAMAFSPAAFVRRITLRGAVFRRRRASQP